MIRYAPNFKSSRSSFYSFREDIKVQDRNRGNHHHNIAMEAMTMQDKTQDRANLGVFSHTTQCAQVTFLEP